MKDYKLKNLRTRLGIWIVVALLSYIVGGVLLVETKGAIIAGILVGVLIISFVTIGELKQKIRIHKTHKKYIDDIENVYKSLVDRTLIADASILREFIYEITEE